MSKKILIITIIIVVIGVILFSVKTKDKSSDAGDGTIPSTASSSVGNDFIRALLGVNSISLDVSLLNSPAFNSLDASGAYVDPSPEKGRTDPFYGIGKESVNSPATQTTESSRVSGLGVNNVGNAEIIISKITSTTAAISIRGINENEKVSVVLLGSNDSLTSATNFSYKKDTGEYSAIVTGLIPKITYTVRIQSPESFVGLQADFTTK